ncbi:MAG TPA: hypothetical protein VIU64_22565 [Polyangia bacterium]
MVLGWAFALGVVAGLAPRVRAAPAAPRAPWQAQPGSKAFVVPEGALCAGTTGDWNLSVDGRTVRPPATRKTTDMVEATWIPDGGKCASDGQPQPLALTGAWPTFDPSAIWLSSDEGRLEIRGTNLKGVTVHWQLGNKSGDDTCLEPTVDGNQQRCVLAVGHGLPADPATVQLSVWPAEAARVPGSIFFDETGHRASAERFQLRPSRIIIAPPLAQTGAVDVSDGIGHIPLEHPEAISWVDCGTFRCDLVEDGIQVHSGPVAATAVNVRVRLAPKIFVSKADTLETTQSATIPLVRCPLAFASNEPLREVDGTRVVMRVDARCGKDLGRLKWSANGDPAEVLRVQSDQGTSYAVLRVGRIERDHLTVTAVRDDPDRPVVGSVSIETKAAPHPRATLELPGYGTVDYIPKNRDALVHIAGSDKRLVVLPIEGIYSVHEDKNGVTIRAEPVAGGTISLRFGYRAPELHGDLAKEDLAVLSEAVTRTIREASVPAALNASEDAASPLLELFCQARDKQVRQVQGKLGQVPFSDRDSCRLVIHRERLKREDGSQDIAVDADVYRQDGTPRPEGHISEHLVLNPGDTARTIWLHGARQHFDRIVVRVSHVVDESHYLSESAWRSNLPVAQWSVMVGSGHARFYATAAIPTGLFRVNAPSSVLSLNFGILSRLALLDHEGRESLIGLELGAMGVGLASVSNFPATLDLIAGLGISLPLGARGEVTQSSVNLHAWVVKEFRPDVCTNTMLSPGADGCRLASRWAFIFGPSISIGNIGTNL